MGSKDLSMKAKNMLLSIDSAYWAQPMAGLQWPGLQSLFFDLVLRIIHGHQSMHPAVRWRRAPRVQHAQNSKDLSMNANNIFLLIESAHWAQRMAGLQRPALQS